MRGLTDKEQKMFNQLGIRLSDISSSVVRCQMLLQMSQLLDIAYLGDYDRERELQLVAQIDELCNKVTNSEI